MKLKKNETEKQKKLKEKKKKTDLIQQQFFDIAKMILEYLLKCKCGKTIFTVYTELRIKKRYTFFKNVFVYLEENNHVLKTKEKKKIFYKIHSKYDTIEKVKNIIFKIEEENEIEKEEIDENTDIEENSDEGIPDCSNFYS